MSSVELYSSPLCGYCHAAKRLLSAKGISFSEINVALSPQSKAEMIDRAGGRRTVPQIFVSGQHVGGYDDLVALDRAGKLDALLAA
ncbi:MAG: glutaredoxin 3 [Pseudomonadota bacterium]